MIDSRIKEAWRQTANLDIAFRLGYFDAAVNAIRDAYLDAEAGRRMAEFQRDHHLSDIGFGELNEWCDWCMASRFSGNLNERHAWTLADWRAEVEGELNA